MKRRVGFHVTGRVQGVAYRASARDQAGALGVQGWIRNTDAGAVEGEVEGEASAVDAFLAWCKKGPPGARVDRLAVSDAELAEPASGRFEIRR